MDENLKKALQLAKKMNSISNAERLSIPVLDGFDIVREEQPYTNVVFLAQKDNMIEQFIVDGALENEETITQRIEKVVEAVRNRTEKNPLYEKENYIYNYKTYKNDLFEFNIYVQDIIIGTRKEKQFIRQLNAYFIEKDEKEFCQVSVAIGPYIPSDINPLIKDIKDFSKNSIITNLDAALKVILDNITYKEELDEEKVERILDSQGYEKL